MDVPDLFLIILSLHVRMCGSIKSELAVCHDNFSQDPPDGLLPRNSFPWLGIVQYVHVTSGELHHTKSPRVILVHRQFVLGTASDLSHLPKNYKLGNVIFGDYVREEEECSLTRSQVKMGVVCGRAYLEVPVEDVSPHPEFSRFGVGNSLALIKLVRPLKSRYMIPVCLPTIGERTRQKSSKKVMMVDYITTVPRGFDADQIMAKKTVKLYTHNDCKRHRLKMRLGSEGVTHVLCSSGCGVRHGTPIITHSAVGMFELMGMAATSTTCRHRRMRKRLNPEPPLYIDVFPYVTWIINIISAHLLPQPYPHNFQLTDAGEAIRIRKGEFLRKRRRQRTGWKARMFVSGNLCYKPESKIRTAANFYTELFEVNADPPAKLNVFMKISAGIECTILCVRLILPSRMSNPVIRGVGGYNISIQFETEWFPLVFRFNLALLGKNTTSEDFNEWLPERSPGFF